MNELLVVIETAIGAALLAWLPTYSALLRERQRGVYLSDQVRRLEQTEKLLLEAAGKRSSGYDRVSVGSNVFVMHDPNDPSGNADRIAMARARVASELSRRVCDKYVRVDVFEALDKEVVDDAPFPQSTLVQASFTFAVPGPRGQLKA